MITPMPEAKLKVILLRHTPNPEETIAMAARLCYSPSDIWSLREKIETKDQREFVEKLMKIGHMSPIEHASFTFAVEGISRACSHQLVRHRLASYSQQSQRYVSEETGFDYIIPPTIRGDKELMTFYEKFMDEAQQAYNHIVKKLNEKGKKGEIANQDARFVLPNATETKIMLTMNARELLHFFRQRCCFRAQWEIREMAHQMLLLVKTVAPIIFEKSGPACVNEPCPERVMYCGKAREIKRIYGRFVKGKNKAVNKGTGGSAKKSKVLGSQKGLFQE
ncbi:MAG: FAD-dependent thymidylate synthase [Nitrospirae bacterium]|nr:FAD-dependent thymidylate synthase [Nitrospirota bacterium]